MSKVIAVYGNAGSGKTIFTCILARTLLNKQKSDPQKIIVISPNSSTPMIPVLVPDQKIELEQSFGSLFALSEIGIPEVAKQVVLLESCPYIGILGWRENENLDSQHWTEKNVLSVIDGAAKLVDYVIIDCAADLRTFTQAAVERADIGVQIITPDLRGLQYYACQKKYFQNHKSGFDKQYIVSGLARPYHALDEIAYVVDRYMGYLPYQKEIDKCAVEGGYFEAYAQCGKKYMEMVEAVIAKVRV